MLNELLLNESLSETFAQQLIDEAHRTDITGFNIDLEADRTVPWIGDGRVNTWLQFLTDRLHSASPPVLVGIDGDSGRLSNCPCTTTGVDRWVSMDTYFANATMFRREIARGLKLSGEKFGVGLCQCCGVPASAIADRFAAIAAAEKQGLGRVAEIDLWAYGTGPEMEQWWHAMEMWLAA